MDWDDIRVFLHIARMGSVIGAARAVGVDHSTMSRRLARLEAAIGAALFERAGRRLRITDAGIGLRTTAEAMESTLLQQMDLLAAGDGEVSGRVRIGAPEGFGAGYLGEVLGRISLDLPRVEIELVALPQSYSLASREVDIAITLDRPEAGNVMTRRLVDYTLGLFGTDAYRERHGWPGSLADLPQHRLCGYIPELLHTRELDYLRFGEIHIIPYLKSTSIIAQMEMIAGGEVIGILPSFLATKNPKLIDIMPTTIKLVRSYWLSVHNDLRAAARVKAVRSALYKATRRDRLRFQV